MRRWIGPALALLDVACIVGGIATAWQVWLWLAPNLQLLVQVHFGALWGRNPWMPSATVWLLAWIVAIRQLGLYEPGRMENSVRIVSELTRSTVYMAVFTIVTNFLVGERLYPKGLVLPALGSTWLYLCATRLLVFRLILRLEAPPTADNAVIIGVEEDAVLLEQHMARQARHVCRVAGFVGHGAAGPAAVPLSRVLGDVADLPQLVNRHDLRIVMLATHTLSRDDAMRLARQADHMGLRVLQAPFAFGVVSPRIGFVRVGGLELIDLASVRYTTFAERVKRGFDIVAVLLGGVFVLPIFALVALAIKVDDRGPVFYHSRRVGRGGRTFEFLKFRSMVVGADRMKDQLRAQNEAGGALFKMRGDPRITRIGHFIRRWSIDELPQIVNVLRGEMNLVGPRPLPAGDLVGVEGDPEMSFWFEQRAKVNPGITGLWQVSGRSDLGFDEMVRHDIHYIQNWSFWLDLQILVKTVPAVLQGRGAR